MSKLIDADKLESEIVRLRDIYCGIWVESEMFELIDAQPEAIISCPRCHGNGEYEVAIWSYGTPKKYELEKCLICKGTGKVSIEVYEDYQERYRGKK